MTSPTRSQTSDWSPPYLQTGQYLQPLLPVPSVRWTLTERLSNKDASPREESKSVLTWANDSRAMFSSATVETNFSFLSALHNYFSFSARLSSNSCSVSRSERALDFFFCSASSRMTSSVVFRYFFSISLLCLFTSSIYPYPFGSTSRLMLVISTTETKRSFASSRFSEHGLFFLYCGVTRSLTAQFSRNSCPPWLESLWSFGMVTTHGEWCKTRENWVPGKIEWESLLGADSQEPAEMGFVRA